MKQINLLFAFLIGYGVAMYTPVVTNINKIMKELKKFKELEEKVEGIDDRETKIIRALNSHKEAIVEINKKLETVRVNKSVKVVIEEQK